METSLGNVQQKISCVFQTKVVEESSSKRNFQSYRIIASDVLRDPEAVRAAVSSEKIDGTCSYISDFESKPWLWARLDRKPTKPADKRFKKFQNTLRAWQLTGENDDSMPVFEWDVSRDFKETPPNWVPADAVIIVDGIPQPNELGHIPGWVPIDPASRQHLWHLSSVDLDNGLGLFLKQASENIDDGLEIVVQELKSFCGMTFELIGTNVNNNPYKLGTKENPFHILVKHGMIPFSKSPPLDFDELKNWFEVDPEGAVEGIVWHCSNGKMFKLHRHHMDLKWPVDNLKLNSMKVKINIELERANFSDSTVIKRLVDCNGSVHSSLKDLTLEICKQA